MAPPTQPRVTVVTTGGTIASRIDPATGAAIPVVRGDELVALLPGVEQIADLTVRELSLIPSWDFTPAFMQRIAEAVMAELAAGARGVVVTQGTDTLEETAYWLDLTVDIERLGGAVAITGAMRNNSELGADGPRNLLDAIRVAAVGERSLLRRPVVVANGQIHAARDVAKTDSFNPATFQSPGSGPVGFVDGPEVIAARVDVARQPILDVGSPDAQVPLLKWVAGADDLLLRACLDAAVDGVVIEGFGLGHVPGTVVPTIAELRGRSIPIVLTTRCQTGPTLPIYGGAGGGRDLAEMGVIFASRLPGPKARLLLIAALASGIVADELPRLFEREGG